jgi:hypothetical protein
MGVVKKIPILTPRKVARFWKRVIKSNGCWVWTGPDKVMVGGEKYKPARIAYALSCEEPVGCVIRLCDTPKCVCPAHLKDVSEHDAGIRGYVGSVLKIRSPRTSAGLIALNENKPLKLIEAIRYGKLL